MSKTGQGLTNEDSIADGSELKTVSDTKIKLYFPWYYHVWDLMGESPVVDRSAVTNRWMGLNTESILYGSSGYSFTFDMDDDTPNCHPGADDTFETFANLDPRLHGVGPDHLNPFKGDEDRLILASDPDVTQDGSDGGMPLPPTASTHKAKTAPSQEPSEGKVSGTANKGRTKKNGWSEIADSLAEDRRVRAELEAKKLEAHDAHEWAKAEAVVEKVHIKHEVKLEMEKARLQAAHEERAFQADQYHLQCEEAQWQRDHEIAMLKFKPGGGGDTLQL